MGCESWREDDEIASLADQARNISTELVLSCPTSSKLCNMIQLIHQETSTFTSNFLRLKEAPHQVSTVPCTISERGSHWQPKVG